MSVLLNITMPKTCEVCPCNDDNWRCGATGEHFDYEDKYERRRADCPLIEVPPHGRLIDADKLEKGFKRAIVTYLPKDPTRHMDIVNGSECRGWTYALMAVQEAKTVIEAEGDQ